MVDIPIVEPKEIRAGDTLQWTREDLTADYPASAWTLKYYIINASRKYTITATADGDYFDVTVVKTTTDDYIAGTYSMIGQVTSLTEAFTVYEGVVEILPDISATATTALETRSTVKQTLDALDSLILGKASSDVSQYTIAGRSIVKFTPDELLKWRNVYAAYYQAELDRIASNSGKSTSNIVRVQFKNAS